MATITLDLPDSAFRGSRRTPEEMASEMRLAASLFWFSRGLVSQGWAAEFAGLSRSAFLNACFVNQVQAVVIDFDEIDRELGRR